MEKCKQLRAELSRDTREANRSMRSSQDSPQTFERQVEVNQAAGGCVVEIAGRIVHVDGDQVSPVGSFEFAAVDWKLKHRAGQEVGQIVEYFEVKLGTRRRINAHLVDFVEEAEKWFQT